VGPRVGLEVMERRELLVPPGIEPQLLGRAARSLLVISTELSRPIYITTPSAGHTI
jgi:hypothetical protein